MPRHDLVVWILWRRMRMEARWERKRKMRVTGTKVRISKDHLKSSPLMVQMAHPISPFTLS